MDNLNSVVFLYSKEGKIRVLDIENARTKNNDLEPNGWKHTATLDACKFIESLLNGAEDFEVLESIKELKHG